MGDGGFRVVGRLDRAGIEEYEVMRIVVFGVQELVVRVWHDRVPRPTSVVERYIETESSNLPRLKNAHCN